MDTDSNPTPPSSTTGGRKHQQTSQRVLGNPLSLFTRETLRILLERSGVGFIPLVSILTFIYGIMWVIPVVVAGTSPLVHLFALLVPSWCLFGILANLFLLHFRDTSIRGRLSRIVPKGNDVRDNDGGVYVLDNHVMIDAADLKLGWFFCKNCQVYVPPRAWHCLLCKTCILRRDHHCVFSNSCIGEDNHINFLGFLLYLILGTIYAIVVGLIYISQHLGVSPYWYALKSLCTLYIVLFDFSILNMLGSLVIPGGTVSLVVFCFYLRLAFKNETVSDKKRGVKFSITEQQYSYTNLKTFLGPNPLLRLFWPFSHISKKEYGSALRPKGQLNVDVDM